MRLVLHNGIFIGQRFVAKRTFGIIAHDGAAARTLFHMVWCEGKLFEEKDGRKRPYPSRSFSKNFTTLYHMRAALTRDF
jgi:hypothetical protein